MCDESTDRAKEAKAQAPRVGGGVHRGQGNKSDAQGKRKLISPETPDQQVWKVGKRIGNENREIK